MDNLIFLIVGFVLGVAQCHWWPEPWPYFWGLISRLWKPKPPTPMPPGG